jgi:hypothetical protein
MLLLDSKITSNHNKEKNSKILDIKKKKSHLDSDICFVQHAGLNIVLAFEC